MVPPVPLSASSLHDGILALYSDTSLLESYRLQAIFAEEIARDTHEMVKCYGL